jgi:hypothetical protein
MKLNERGFFHDETQVTCDVHCVGKNLGRTRIPAVDPNALNHSCPVFGRTVFLRCRVRGERPDRFVRSLIATTAVLARDSTCVRRPLRLDFTTDPSRLRSHFSLFRTASSVYDLLPRFVDVIIRAYAHFVSLRLILVEFRTFIVFSCNRMIGRKFFYSRTRISAQNAYRLLEHTSPRKEATQFCVESFHVGVCSNN